MYLDGNFPAKKWDRYFLLFAVCPWEKTDFFSVSTQ